MADKHVRIRSRIKVKPEVDLTKLVIELRQILEKIHDKYGIEEKIISIETRER